MSFIKKIAALLLATGYLLSATETGELLKLPLLADHYYDHKAANGNAGLISFLVQHYFTEDGTDKDAAEDRQLPFKSAEQSAATSFVSSNPPGSFIITRPETACDQNFITYNECVPYNSYLDTIWQPPRYC
ncbi:MAG: hypothetical protein IPP72_18405 [Chitinophagaceae bacterium]|nr:hypothetical protein [Chitinophagaceae bacterium]